jgi:L-lactate dehydrogenase complex protein LldE
MKVGLFIPCYVDQFFPKVAISTLELLEKLGINVGYPLNQTCCGQPLANAGFERYGKDAAKHFVDQFKAFDSIVTPSGSCAYHIKKHYEIFSGDQAFEHVRSNIFELGEFLKHFGYLDEIKARFPFKVGLHQSCHGQRGLRLAKSSEKVGPKFNIIGDLLQKVDGLDLITLNRTDECCGFGGSFSITEEALSVKMGKDRLSDHLNNGVEVITSADMSCLMHLEGIIKRNQLPIKVLHIAEILNSKL